MSRRYARLLVAGCAAVLAVPVGATTALAAATWTIRPGGPVSLKSGTFTLKDTKTGTMITCSSAGMSGTLKAAAGCPAPASPPSPQPASPNAARLVP